MVVNSRSINLLSGLAPYITSQSWTAISTIDLSITSFSWVSSKTLFDKSLSRSWNIERRASTESGSKTTISSNLLISSGGKCALTSCMTSFLALRNVPVSCASTSYFDPRLLVSMITVFVKSTVFPWPSVSLPSSITYKSMLSIFGCAFSISSNRMTAYLFLTTYSVSCPAWSYPTYPGGAPISLETECCSVYSDISILISACSVSNSSHAIYLAKCVLPEPELPRNKNEPSGCYLLCRFAFERMIALQTVSTASFWPITRSWIVLERLTIFWRSDWVSFATGIPVHFETTMAISSSVTTALTNEFCF